MSRRRPPTRRRAVLGLGAAALAMAASLTSCTPSGYGAEKAATAAIHQLRTGTTTSSGQVDCSTFNNIQPDVFAGGCSVGSRGYLVRSDYEADGTGTVLVAIPGGQSGSCAMVRTPNGSWVVWRESCYLN